MTDQVKEQISALVDDALPAQERSLLLARMVSDGDLRATWSRYHLIQDSLRNHLPQAVTPDLSARVMAALENEPAHDRATSQSRNLTRWLKPVAGLAVAASVAVFAVMVFQPQGTDSGAGVQVAEVSPPPVPAPDQYRRVTGTQWQGQQASVSEQLNQYLVNHNEFAARNGMPMMAPHVRIVGFDQGQR